jgi:O-antigen ligase
MSRKLDALIPYFLILTGFFVPLSITVTDLTMAITAGLGLVSGRCLRQFDSLKRNPMVWLALWMVFWVAVSMTWSIGPWADRLSALHKYSKLLYIPLLLSVCTEAKWRDRTIHAFLLGTGIVVILSYLKAWTGLSIGRNPNPAFVFYTHIETSFLVAFATYLLGLYAWKDSRRRWFYVALVAVFTYQEFFINDGRTGWVAYGVLLLLFTIHWVGWKGVLLGTVFTGLLAVIFYQASPTFRNICQESVKEVRQYQSGHMQTSLGYRLTFDSLSWGLAKEKPWFGYGAGSFATALQQQGGVPGWRVVRTPHNEYLMVMVELGVIGLISLLLLFGCQWSASLRLGEMTPFAQGLLLAFMVSSLYNAFLYLSVSGHFYVLFIALFYGSVSNRYSETHSLLRLNPLYHRASPL